VAAVVTASIAGAQAGVALRLGLGMLGLQFAIGAANDLSDTPSDAVAKPGKPIPAGLVSARAAAIVCLGSAGLGLVAAATVGVGALAIGFAGLADGLAYDLRLKGTPMAPLAFAAGVGLLPLYAWWGARGSVPDALFGVAIVAVCAGASLALANAYADIERDRKSGIASVATVLGPRRTLWINAALLALVQVVAAGTTLATAGATPLLAVEACGCGLGWLGLGLAAIPTERTRPLVWEVQAMGILVLGASWLAVLNSAGALRG
jgi:1,4-dihydroxy-2-naphthoate octaprenyltransferase